MQSNSNDNAFKRIAMKFEEQLPDVVEENIRNELSRLDNARNMLETFGPNAINVLVTLVSGEVSRRAGGDGPVGYFEEEPDWRFPPGFRAPGR
jgi:hypothetical protein